MMAGSKFDTFTVFPNLPKEIRLMIWERTLRPRVVNLRQRKLNKTIGEWETETGNTWPPSRGGMVGEGAEEEDNHAFLDLRESSRWRGRERAALADALNANIFDENAYKEAHLVGLFSDCPPPDILRVCREAFQVVSKSYHKVFSPLGSIPTTWFCFELDTLYLRHDNFSAYYADSSLVSVTYDLGDSAFNMLDMDNLLKVKNLALLLTGDNDDADMPLEKFIAALASTIRGLENLYLVVKHYEKEGQDATCLSITDPMNFAETIRSYKLFNPTVWWEEVAEEVPLNSSDAEVNLEDLERILAEDVSRGGTSWNIPKIETKVVLDREYAGELARARRAAKMKVDELVKEHKAYEMERGRKREIKTETSNWK
jgi:hypothetical protein